MNAVSLVNFLLRVEHTRDPSQLHMPTDGVSNILSRNDGQKLVGFKWQAVGLEALCLRVQERGILEKSSLGMLLHSHSTGEQLVESWFLDLLACES